MSDGLDALMAQRNAAKRPPRAKRAMPAVRHPRTVAPAPQDNAGPQDAAHGTAESAAASEAVQPAVAEERLDHRSAAQPEALLETSPGSAANEAAAAPEPSVADTPRPAVVDAQAEPREATQPLAARAKPAATKRGSARPSPAPAAAAAAENIEADKVKPKTLSLTRNNLDWLDDVRLAGMMQRPKVDIPHSAVVRLALERLQEDMTVEEIRDHFVGRTGTGTPGRPRL